MLLRVVMLCTLLMLSASINHWGNTTNGVHRFLVADDKFNRSEILTFPKAEFIWGSGHVKLWRASQHNKHIVLSKYMPFARAGHNLTWWKLNHPDWILYRCDRKTPAFYGHDTNVPLVFSNPAVIDFQIKTYAIPAKKAGFDAIGADNLSFYNDQRGCGYWNTTTQWVQLFDGKFNGGKTYVDAVMFWVTNFATRLHNEVGLLLVPNFSLGDVTSWDDPNVLTLGNYTDGILSERGFTAYGSYFVKTQQWYNEIHFMANLQRWGKAYLSINEYRGKGRVPAYVREYAVGSYLIGKTDHSAVFVSGDQQYGGFTSYPELFAPIGEALTPAIPPQVTAQGVVWRNYTKGLVLVNPTKTGASYELDDILFGYHNLTGANVTGTVALPSGSAVILLRSQKL